MVKISVTPDQLKEFERLERVAMQYRGKFIHYFATVEAAIESVIARHYCGVGDKAIDFIHSVIADYSLSFDFKQRAFVFLITKYYSEVAQANPKIAEELEDLKKWRNALAHRKVLDYDTGKQGGEGGNDITFEDFFIKNGNYNTKPMKMTPDIFNQKLEIMERLRTAFVELNDRIIEEATKGKGESK